MKELLEKYYIEPGSILVYHETTLNRVDCWFDLNEIRVHRCLSIEDFYALNDFIDEMEGS